jgi:hypothetical protein
MSFVTTRNRSILAAALLLPFAGSMWLIFARSTMSSSTFAAAAAVLLGTAAIGLTTWKNGQAAMSIGQVIRKADVRPARIAEAANAHRG